VQTLAAFLSKPIYREIAHETPQQKPNPLAAGALSNDAGRPCYFGAALASRNAAPSGMKLRKIKGIK
jgi:hypothetical protein